MTGPECFAGPSESIPTIATYTTQNILEGIGPAIANVRRAANMSQAGVAASMCRLGVQWSQATVSKIELNQRIVQLHEGVALATLFRCTLDQFITGANYEAIAAGRRLNEIDDQIAALQGERDMLVARLEGGAR
ncbi:helix-turn-helix transcriptional regulator [Tsukamurella sp. NPDC003166]|uniref:helix-turn-helix domain-containing protein n=1 Tax=Tsukamurella sp. NPDC003166 TaxID=3154444 RepID=UPI0033A188F4